MILIFLGICLYGTLVQSFGVRAGTVLFICICFIGRELYKKYLETQKLKWYGQLTHDLYIVSQHPRDRRKLNIDDVDIKECIIVEKHEDVLHRKVEEEKILLRSGNELAARTGLAKDKRLSVKTIIFREGRNCNESWTDFENRIIRTIQKDRVIKHEAFLKYDAAWYYKYMQNQRNVNWSKTT